MRLLLGCLASLLLCGGAAAQGWTPKDFPNPTQQGALCNRPGIVSFVCDADSLLAKADLDTIEVSKGPFRRFRTTTTRLQQLLKQISVMQGIIKQLAIPEEPFAGPDCDFLPLGRAGFQASITRPCNEAAVS